VDLEYQIAQKIHAVTDPLYARVHDLVDLQLLWTGEPDLPTLHELCVRTFAWRKRQSWPPLPLREMSGWEHAYDDSREETEIGGETTILTTLMEARRWLAEVIERI